MGFGYHTPRHGWHLLHLQRDGARCRLLLHWVASPRGLVAELVATTGTSPKRVSRGRNKMGELGPETLGNHGTSPFWAASWGKWWSLPWVSVWFSQQKLKQTWRGSGVKVRQSKMGWHQLQFDCSNTRDEPTDNEAAGNKASKYPGKFSAMIF